MSLAVVILSIFLGLIVLAFFDLYKRMKKSTNKTNVLFTQVQQVMSNLVRERELEKALAQEKEEKLKNEVKQAMGDLPETPEHDHDNLDDRYEQVYHDEDEIQEDGPFHKVYEVNHEDVYFFPCLDGAMLPMHYKLPQELVPVIRKKFNLPEDNSRLIEYDFILKFLKEKGVTIIIKYPKLDNLGDTGKISYGIKKMTREEYEENKNNNLVTAVDLTTNNRKLVKYNDGGEIIFKECEDINLYKSYIKKFGDRGMDTIDELPTGEQFIEWYNKAIDDFARLKEVEKFGNGV